MKYLKKFFDFLTRNALATIVVNIVLTGAVTLMVTQWVNDRQTVAAVRTTEIGEFEKTAQEFDGLTRAYMVKVTDTERVDSQSKEALLANIQRQYVQLESVGSYLPANSKHVAVDYKRNLVELSGEIQLADDILSTAPVWRKLNGTIQLKRQLVIELRRAAKLPV